ncbi:aldehyde dehydrogenase [Nocardiopsis terrae]|uniref:NADP-dependent aldehyde dehydrogenase n=1 Tax=Nocardiopsis terrae TaxID=372655 RepID=A0ABR9HHC4_9ACTN|nr:aldehyde dehydrogenase (NADP(+)) [Nocardiopsis terrae]MBE1458424.1 NADP-dependent aldehyde dehydrogenase [Nocardiopsis terrae]GHC80558.1 aldehyde dehydrogenase [Nocardiopsis terrae]
MTNPETTPVTSIDPRTGKDVETVTRESTTEEVRQACRAAADAAPALARLGRLWRADLLQACADALEKDREELVRLADRETALGPQRLNGELTRTTYQFQTFAEEIREGAYLEAVVDRPGQTPAGPRPDLRRMLVPLGPVAVFGASNFPFAFSVPGGDTASALAAGCPVVVKAHPAHPATSQRTFEALTGAARAVGAPEGLLGLVHGLESGRALVLAPEIRAAAFTGSTRAGRALWDLACSRPDPIPFYGELGSLDPLVVTPAAAAARGEQIAEGLFGSFTLGAGQFCTKPGLVLLPGDQAGSALVDRLAQAVRTHPAQTLLTEGIKAAYTSAELPGRLVAEGPADEEGWSVPARLLQARLAELTPDGLDECFGPLTLVATYDDEEELLRFIEELPASLTASLFSESDERGLRGRLAERLLTRTGRLVHDGFPTGVAVSAAMQHGGPWPATTNALHTSVGATSLRRFLRPVSWQNAPADLLPDELRDEPEHPVARRES